MTRDDPPSVPPHQTIPLPSGPVSPPPAPPRPPTRQEPTNVSYSSISPSDREVFTRKVNRYREWVEQVAADGGVTAPESTMGKAGGVGSAAWNSRETLNTDSGTGLTSREEKQRTATQAQPIVHESQALLPRPPKTPPAPLLAQTPPQPASHESLRYPQHPSSVTPGGFLHPISARSSRAEREAYIASALDLPLEMLAEVSRPPVPAVQPSSDTSDTSSKLTRGRLASLLSIRSPTHPLKGRSTVKNDSNMSISRRAAQPLPMSKLTVEAPLSRSSSNRSKPNPVTMSGSKRMTDHALAPSKPPPSIIRLAPDEVVVGKTMISKANSHATTRPSVLAQGQATVSNLTLPSKSVNTDTTLKQAISRSIPVSAVSEQPSRQPTLKQRSSAVDVDPEEPHMFPRTTSHVPARNPTMRTTEIPGTSHHAVMETEHEATVPSLGCTNHTREHLITRSARPEVPSLSKSTPQYDLAPSIERSLRPNVPSDTLPVTSIGSQGTRRAASIRKPPPRSLSPPDPADLEGTVHPQRPGQAVNPQVETESIAVPSHRLLQPLPRPALSRSIPSIDGLAQTLGRKSRNASDVNLTARFEPSMYPLPASKTTTDGLTSPETARAATNLSRGPSRANAHSHDDKKGSRSNISLKAGTIYYPKASQRHVASSRNTPAQEHQTAAHVPEVLEGVSSPPPPPPVPPASKITSPEVAIPWVRDEHMDRRPFPAPLTQLNHKLGRSGSGTTSTVQRTDQSIPKDAVTQSRTGSTIMSGTPSEADHVSFEVPSGSRGRLRISLAWIRDGGRAERLRRKKAEFSQASPPPVPPKNLQSIAGVMKESLHPHVRRDPPPTQPPQVPEHRSRAPTSDRQPTRLEIPEPSLPYRESDRSPTAKEPRAEKSLYDRTNLQGGMYNPQWNANVSPTGLPPYGAAYPQIYQLQQPFTYPQPAPFNPWLSLPRTRGLNPGNPFNGIPPGQAPDSSRRASSTDLSGSDSPPASPSHMPQDVTGYPPPFVGLRDHMHDRANVNIQGNEGHRSQQNFGGTGPSLHTPWQFNNDKYQPRFGIWSRLFGRFSKGQNGTKDSGSREESNPRVQDWQKHVVPGRAPTENRPFPNQQHKDSRPREDLLWATRINGREEGMYWNRFRGRKQENDRARNYPFTRPTRSPVDRPMGFLSGLNRERAQRPDVRPPVSRDRWWSESRRDPEWERLKEERRRRKMLRRDRRREKEQSRAAGYSNGLATNQDRRIAGFKVRKQYTDVPQPTRNMTVPEGEGGQFGIRPGLWNQRGRSAGNVKGWVNSIRLFKTDRPKPPPAIRTTSKSNTRSANGIGMTGAAGFGGYAAPKKWKDRLR